MVTPNSTDHTALMDTHESLYDLPNYAGLEQYSGMMKAHIACMALAWSFILPLGVMLTIARSRLMLPVQSVFVMLNSVGVFLGVIYNINTPNLYENNAHRSVGWIATWIVTVQVVTDLCFAYFRRNKAREPTFRAEPAAFLRLATIQQEDSRASNPRRWSRSGYHETTLPSSANEPEDSDLEHSEDVETEPEMEAQSFAIFSHRSRKIRHRSTIVYKYVPTRVSVWLSRMNMRAAETMYEIANRTILIFGYIALLTGVVTYTGIMRSGNVFNGLAHFIKGGIFFWYGLLTLGRWSGCFADFGWAWNVKPVSEDTRRTRIPSVEFIESLSMFFYGSTNVWLEHLAAWGGEWTAQDFEHVSISVMFLGGGLVGLLVESIRIRGWLDAPVEMMHTQHQGYRYRRSVRMDTAGHRTTLNPMPALVVFFLGIIMTSHHQDSVISTNVHRQWGTLLCCFSVFRGVTYIVHSFAPPKSVFPSRPPTELVTSFCLIAGGILLMISTKDIMYYMEQSGMMATFTLTITVGFVSSLMAYTILVLAVKGWAVRQEQ